MWGSPLATWGDRRSSGRLPLAGGLPAICCHAHCEGRGKSEQGAVSGRCPRYREPISGRRWRCRERFSGCRPWCGEPFGTVGAGTGSRLRMSPATPGAVSGHHRRHPGAAFRPSPAAVPGAGRLVRLLGAAGEEGAARGVATYRDRSGRWARSGRRPSTRTNRRARGRVRACPGCSSRTRSGRPKGWWWQRPWGRRTRGAWKRSRAWRRSYPEKGWPPTWSPVGPEGAARRRPRWSRRPPGRVRWGGAPAGTCPGAYHPLPGRPGVEHPGDGDAERDDARRASGHGQPPGQLAAAGLPAARPPLLRPRRIAGHDGQDAGVVAVRVGLPPAVGLGGIGVRLVGQRCRPVALREVHRRPGFGISGLPGHDRAL